MTGSSSRRGSLRLGTMGWSYRFLVGALYPEGTKPSGYLTEYARSLPTVEADSTFYRIPSQQTVKGWAEQVPDDFRFAVKLAVRSPTP